MLQVGMKVKFTTLIPGSYMTVDKVYTVTSVKGSVYFACDTGATFETLRAVKRALANNSIVIL